jgi:ATP-dependent exoDNAse (exonuclease V) beta subunit
MAGLSQAGQLPDAPARLIALTDYDRTLLVEAGAGSGKTALMAGRVALLIASGVHPKEIVAITFTEAAASEILERVERFVQRLLQSPVPEELRQAVPDGLSKGQREYLTTGARNLDEITCTTIHGFCQQLVKPYPVESANDPGAVIIDPAAAALAYQDLMTAWLSARFGRDRGAQGLGRIPPIADAGSKEDFFAELLLKAPDDTLSLIDKTAKFLKVHRTARVATNVVDAATLRRLPDAVAVFAAWYNSCGLVEPATRELIEDLNIAATLARDAAAGPLNGQRLAGILFHTAPQACKSKDIAFRQWGRKGKWKNAASACGRSVAHGEQLSAAGEAHYRNCESAYNDFCIGIGTLAFQRFVAEFDALKELYRDYKTKAALLDFDDLLYQARDLLKTQEPVRKALAQRYPRILVDEFQDTDPLQAEILWRLAGDGVSSLPWQERPIRPGALFLVGDPKQAIYRFRGADVETYLIAKRALAARDPNAIINISASFRSQRPILEFVNSNFGSMLDQSQGQPGFTALAAVRDGGDRPSVAVFEIAIEDRHRNANGRLSAEEVRREEAVIVADLVRRLIGNYPVWDKEEGAIRPARPGDIALLAPTGTSLWIYERALEIRDISIATQAGKGFFRRQEVQDLIAVVRIIADRRDTLALGALIRGPLVGLTEEEIADEIYALCSATDKTRPLHLWTDLEIIRNPILKGTLAALQNLARKARRTTPYQLLAEAVEQLHIRPLLKARHPRGAERALANVELILEMARAYAGRGILDFSLALRESWEEGDAQAEGRPDAQSEAVSIITIHSAKGLEWPIVIPINSTTTLRSDFSYVYRRRDDSVHFKVFGFPSPDYDNVVQVETDELRRERVRLWYVALTRARDLLLLPRQSDRIAGDWLSVVTLDLASLPIFDSTQLVAAREAPAAVASNTQDMTTWEREASVIVASERRILWHQPSRHEGPSDTPEVTGEVFVGIAGIVDQLPDADERIVIQGGRERGLVLHKLIEEVLNGETVEIHEILKARGRELLTQMGLVDAADPATGPSSDEMAGTVSRALLLPEIVQLRPRLVAELPVYAAEVDGQNFTLTAGIADAVAMNEAGKIEAVVDWKSDVDPAAAQVEIYQDQVRDYLSATGAEFGLIVFLSSGRVERVLPPK